MKKNLSSWIFIAAVLLIGGYSIYDYQHSQSEQQNDKSALRLFSFDAMDVVSVRVQKIEGEPMTLTRKGEQWNISSTVEDRADLQTAVAFVSAVLSEKVKAVKKEGEIQWKDYKLDQPAVVIEIENSKNQKESISISSMPAFDGSFFIRQGDQLYIGASSWGATLSRTAEELRDKKLFRDPFNIVRLDVLYNDKDLKQKYQITKDEQTWKLTDKNMDQYDALKLEQMVQELKNLRANEFLVEPSNAQELKRMGLDNITSKIEVVGPDNQFWWISFGTEQKGVVYAKSSAINGVAKLTTQLIEKIKLSLSDLRNGRLPFQFNLEKVNRLKVSTDLAKVDVKRTEKEWIQSKDDPKMEVNQAVLTQIFQKLQSLNALKYVVKTPADIKYSKSIQLLDADNKELLLIRWSEETAEKQGSQKIVYVRTNKSSETLVLPSMDFMALPVQTLIKAKEQGEQKNNEVKDGEVTHTH